MLALLLWDLFTVQHCTEPVIYYPFWTIMLAFPQSHLFIAQHYTEPITYFPSWTIMLAFPQWHLFTAEYCTELVTYFPSWTVMLAFPQSHLFTAQHCTEPLTSFSLMTCYAGLATVTFIYSEIWLWHPFLHCRDRKQGKQKGKKKNHRTGCQKRPNIPQEAAGGE